MGLLLKAMVASTRSWKRKIVKRGFVAETHVVVERCQILGTVSFGYRTYANDSTLRNVEIGRFCSVGRGCSIGAARHRMDLVSTHPAVSGEGRGPMTKIGHDVWVGDRAIIMSGVTIGTGAVIGAGAIVTKDVPPFAIVAGSPARVLRMRFDEERIKQLMESRWWEYGDSVLGAMSLEEALSRLDSSPVLLPHFNDL